MVGGPDRALKIKIRDRERDSEIFDGRLGNVAIELPVR